jgi:predicted nucleotide-binding protein
MEALDELHEIIPPLEPEVTPAMSEPELRLIAELDASAYGGESIDYEGLRAWWRVYPKGAYVLWKDSKIIGALGLWPIKKTTYERLIKGEIDEVDLKAKDINRIVDGRTYSYWYFADVVLQEEYQNRREKWLVFLLEEAIRQWLSEEILPSEIHLCALGFTGKGISLLERFRFLPAGDSPVRSPTGKPVYQRTVDIEDIRQVLNHLTAIRGVEESTAPHQTTTQKRGKMSQPKLFIGSSQKNLRVAKIIAEGLEDCTDVTIWNEGVFGLNRGFFETILENPKDFDFAVFVLAPDDITTSKDVTKPSPRDNVLFEAGIFLGALGRERVFFVYDEVAEVKIPSDLAGITLAPYDGSRIEDVDARAAVREACRLISDEIGAKRFPHLIGEWKSVYPMTFEEGNPPSHEVVEIKVCRDGLSITSKDSLKNDHYKAFGRVPQERQIIGEWKSDEGQSDTCGVFMLNVSPNANYMYGYFTSPDERGGIAYASWILAKMAGADEAKINERLKKAEDRLKEDTVGIPPTVSGT